MSSAPFIAVNAEAILRRHGLTSFAALWDLDAELVDEPNRARGGISSVSRLRLADEQGQEQVFYLKRQSNYLIRTLRHPLGQSTVAREFQNIETCARLCLPALEVAFFGERRQNGELQAILLTRDLEGYAPLDYWYQCWDELDYRLRQNMIRASAALVARLHASKAVHFSLYPKHVFLKPLPDGMGARFIDLEKLRLQHFSRGGFQRDLDALNRRSKEPSRTQRLRFLLSYLGKERVDAEVRRWVARVLKRSARKNKGR